MDKYIQDSICEESHTNSLLTRMYTQMRASTGNCRMFKKISEWRYKYWDENVVCITAQCT